MTNSADLRRCIQTQTGSPTNSLRGFSMNRPTQTDIVTSNSTTDGTTLTEPTWMIAEKESITKSASNPDTHVEKEQQAMQIPELASNQHSSSGKEQKKSQAAKEKPSGCLLKEYHYKATTGSKIERSNNSPSLLFDSGQFDSILDQIFPPKDAHLVWEPRTSHISKPDSDTPEELLNITKPPG